MSTTTPMMAQYLEIRQQHPDCMLFYRMGDFYELFFEDAVNAASILDIALTKRGQHEGKDIPMAGVPVHSHEMYLLRLLEKGLSVAVCEQIETPEQAKARGAKGPLKRDVVRLITPGTLTEDTLLTPKQANYLLALSPKNKNNQLACAWADFSIGSFYLEIIEESHLDNFLNRINPAEILMPESIWQGLNKNIFEAFKSKIKPISDLRFNLQNTEKCILNTYKISSVEIFGIRDNCTIQATGMMIEYLTLTQKNEIRYLKPPKIIEASDYLKIDAQSFKNLEIVSSLKGTYKESLLHCLDTTQTSMGGRLFHKIITRPLINLKKIKARQNKINFFYKDINLAKSVTEIFKGTPDLERALTRIFLNRAFPRDLKAVQNCFNVNEKIKELLPADNLWKIPNTLEVMHELSKTLNDELPATAFEGKMIQKGVNAELDETIHLRDHGQEQILELEKKYKTETGITNLKIRSNNLIGSYIEVTASHQDKIPSYFKHRQAISNGARYVSEELLELSSKLTQAADAVVKIEYKIFCDLCELILENKQIIEKLSSVLAEMDLYSSIAMHAKNNNYCLPEITEDLKLEIEDGRHAVVEKFAKDVFSPNNCDLSACPFALLTGPNMAGKSTYLRQNALIIWMTHCGLFVPAKNANIGLVDQIFCRIGAADDIAAGRSTFMVEMIETATILHQATTKSFIILDEIGRGTSTQDGLAIAQSVSEYLIENIKARCIFVTHYHELVEIASRYKIQLLTTKILEEKDNIIFLHKIIEGAADKSYGIHVASIAGLPELIIRRAEELLESFNNTDTSRINPSKKMVEKTTESPVINILKTLKLDEITPKIAMDILYEIKNKLNGKNLEQAPKEISRKQPALF